MRIMASSLFDAKVTAGLCIRGWLVIIELRAFIGDEVDVTLDSAMVLDTCCACWEPGGDRNGSGAGGSGAGWIVYVAN